MLKLPTIIAPISIRFVINRGVKKLLLALVGPMRIGQQPIDSTGPSRALAQPRPDPHMLGLE